MAAVAKRKIEKQPVLTQNDIDTAHRVVEFARKRGIDGVHSLHMYLTVAQRQLVGIQTTLADYVKLSGMPFSTASRVAWSMTEDSGMGVDLLRYASHATDRRKKVLVAIIP